LAPATLVHFAHQGAILAPNASQDSGVAHSMVIAELTALYKNKLSMLLLRER
jgi:hypothetical protein